MAPSEPASSRGSKFVCPTCGKTYKSRDSLVRHRHNHEGGPHHVCPICHLNFRRRDLLQRHIRIHSSEEGRKRGQRACKRCKKAKAKCSGGLPCASCLNGGHACSYEPDRETGRLSRRSYRQDVAPPGPSSLDRPNGSPPTTGSGNASAVESNVVPQPAPSLGPWGSSSSGFSSTEFTTTIQAPDTTSDSTEDVMDDMWQSGNSLEPTGWPWLHESLYAQSNPSFTTEQSNASGLRALPLTSGQTRPLDGKSAQNMVLVPDLTHMGGPNSSIPIHSANRNLFSHSPFTIPQQSYFVVPEFVTPQPIPTPKIPLEKTPSSPEKFDQCSATIEQLITFAFNNSSAATSRNVEKRARFWSTMSNTVAGVFGIRQTVSEETNMPHILHHFVKLYFTRFHKLWPLFWVRGFKCDPAPPVLYLTLASIGAMYAERAGNIFGLMLQDGLRRALITAPSQENQDESSNWILQSTLLTMVGCLYFCQRQNFSNAQHLGSILIARARKMNVFREVCLARRHYEETGEECIYSDLPTDAWIRSELKRRLAFGILRADIFLSILLDTKPTISSEEMNLQLPSPDDSWTSSGSAKYQQGGSQLWQLRRPKGLYFSDLVRIAMEYDEPLPSLHFADTGLILVGLQESIWRFSHDADMAHRLTGQDCLVSIPQAFQPASTRAMDVDPGYINSTGVGGLDNHPPTRPTSIPTSIPPSMPTSFPISISPSISTPMRVSISDSNSASLPIRTSPATAYSSSSLLPPSQDSLTQTIHRMSSLRQDYNRTINALVRWNESFTHNQPLQPNVRTRSTLLAARLLYHLSFLRLRADIRTLHLVSYETCGTHSSEYYLAVERTRRWAASNAAVQALDHSLAIWRLLSEESCLGESVRAHFNLMALIALHHAAVVVWSLAGIHPHVDAPGHPLCYYRCPIGLPIARPYCPQMLESIAELFKIITPAWTVFSSFSETARRMSRDLFPLPASVAELAV